MLQAHVSIATLTVTSKAPCGSPLHLTILVQEFLLGTPVLVFPPKGIAQQTSVATATYLVAGYEVDKGPPIAGDTPIGRNTAAVWTAASGNCHHRSCQ